MIDAHVHLLGLGHGAAQRRSRGHAPRMTRSSRESSREHATCRRAPGSPGAAGIKTIGRTRASPRTKRCRARCPIIPVYLTRVDGHAALVNAAAMKAADLDRDQQDPSGGRIERDAEPRSPTGVLVDRAMGLVGRRDSARDKEEMRAATVAAIREIEQVGAHGRSRRGRGPGHDRRVRGIGEGRPVLAAQLRHGPPMTTRHSTHYFARGPQSGLYDGRLWIRAIKISADGALGSRGAALIEPYSDEPKNTRTDHHPARTRQARGVAGARARIPGQRARHRRPRAIASCSMNSRQRSRGSRSPTIAFASSTRRSSTPTTSRALRSSASSRRCRRATRPATCTGPATASASTAC